MRTTGALRFLFILFLLCLPLAAQAHRHHHADGYLAALAFVGMADLPVEARDTLRLIEQGGPFPYERDGAVFGNYERILPPQPRGCTSDTLLTKSAACGRRCEAGAPAPKGSAPPCRARYHEYTVRTPGARNRGARRIVCGKVPECYYSPDHYRTFKRIKE